METFEVEISNQIPQRLWKIHKWSIENRDGKIYAVATIYEDLLEEGLVELEDFQKKYNKAKTRDDAEKLLKELPESQMDKFIQSHEFVKNTTGLNTCQTHYLNLANSIVRNREAAICQKKIQKK